MRRLLVTALFVALGGCDRKPPPLTDAALSILAPSPDAGCEWRRLDPATTRAETIAHLDVACESLAIGWDARGTRAMIGSESAVSLWSGGALLELPPPKLPEIWDAVTAATGRVHWIGFAEDGAPAIRTEAQADVVLEGQPRCTRVRNFEQRLVEGQWVARTAEAASGCDRVIATSAPNVGAFPRLQPFDGGTAITDEQTLYRLETAFPRERTAPMAHVRSPEVEAAMKVVSAEEIARPRTPAWTATETAGSIGATLDSLNGGPPRVRMSPFTLAETERAKATLRAASAQRERETRARTASWTGASFDGGITLARRFETWAFVTSAGAVTPPRSSERTNVCWVREPYVLLTADGAEPRVYDGRNGTLVWSADDAHAVTFWPKPAAPSSVARR